MDVESGKRLAVIILNWNGEDLLKKFLPTASEYTNGDEVDLYVADNGSSDSSVAWIKEHHPDVKLIEFKKNHGFAEGYNLAIEATGYPFTILLNSDVEVTPGWWRPMLAYMENHPEVSALQPKIKSFREKDKFEYAGAAGGYLDSLGYPYCRGRLFESIETDHGQYDNVADVTWASGAALMVRTSVYRKLGGLDPLFFAHMEEIDLCCRMIMAGNRVVAIGDSEVYHVGGASLPQGNPRKTYLNFRNNLLLMYKNLPEKKGRGILFRRRLADTLAFGMFLLKFDLANAKAVVKAHSDFRKMRSAYVPADDCSGPFEILSKRRIILDYYLKNMKK